MDDPTQTLAELLRLTRERELDCDEFVQKLAAYVDGGLNDEVRALMDQHREICPECEEQLQLLRAALGED